MTVAAYVRPKETPTERLERQLGDTLEILGNLLKRQPGPSNGVKPPSILSALMRMGDEDSTPDGFPRATGFRSEQTSGGDTSDPVMRTVLAREADFCPTCTFCATCTTPVREKEHDSKDHDFAPVSPELRGRLAIPPTATEEGRAVPCPTCDGSGRRYADPVDAEVDDILRRLRSIMREVRVLERKRRNLEARVKPLREETLNTCSVCGDGTAERLKSLMDNKCFLAWGSWKLKNPTCGDPHTDRQRFATERRAFLAKKRQEELDADAQVAELQSRKVLPKRRGT